MEDNTYHKQNKGPNCIVLRISHNFIYTTSLFLLFLFLFYSRLLLDYTKI